jgi:hypothetical protein
MGDHAHRGSGLGDRGDDLGEVPGIVGDFVAGTVGITEAVPPTVGRDDGVAGGNEYGL